MAPVGGDDAPRWSSRRTVLAAGLMIGVLLLALFLVLRDSTGTDPQPAGTAPTGGAIPAASPSETTGAAGTDDAVPRMTPPPVSWQVYKGVALPVSTGAGPRRVDGDAAAGYARTPAGALVAASQVSVRYTLADDWRALVNQSLAPGPGRDVWVATRAKYDTVDVPGPGSFCQIAGFLYVDYTPDRSVIQMAYRCPGGQLQTAPLTVAWQDGDWKLVLQPDGSYTPAAARRALASLDGYVVWGGV